MVILPGVFVSHIGLSLHFLESVSVLVEKLTFFDQA